MRSWFRRLLGVMVAAACAGGAWAQGVSLFPLSEVELHEGPLRRAQQVNRRHLMAHNPDRLLAPFRTEAGLDPKAPVYPNWEATGLGGHTAGHYLSALANMVAATGDPELRERLDYMVAEVAACQQAHGDGYVGGVPGSRELWREVAAGDIRAEPFSLNGRWVPWYNLHKLFAGLRDAWLVAENEEAREVLLGLTEWCERLVADLSPQQMQRMLRAEHGGMNDVLADIAAATGEQAHLDLARRFSHREILEPLLAERDRLTGLHANTQIPKVVGYARIGELAGEERWVDAAEFFWETVTENRTVAIGGNSVREHFHPADDFSSMIESNQGPETCNTYNMLRLTEQLFQHEPGARYADFYERAMYNHILASQHPEHGGYVYMTPMRPRHYRVYSQAEQCFWCCVGSGMENHTKYGKFIYAHGEDSLYVNLFVPSAVQWRERGVKLRQETRFPDAPTTRLTLSLESPTEFALHIRRPYWAAADGFRVTVNGRAWDTTAEPSSYAAVRREWRDGDRVEVQLPMETRLEFLPDGSDYAAVAHGPIVLAAKLEGEEPSDLVADDARMGHISSGERLPLDKAPMLVGDVEQLAEEITQIGSEPLTFSAAQAIRPDEYDALRLVPFFRVHDARYMVYWRVASDAEYERVQQRLAREERERLALEARTVDQVQPGEQQPEVEHNFRGERTTTGVHRDRRFRDARGWFSYDLTAPAGRALELQVTYFSGDWRREFDVLVNDEVVGTFDLERRRGDEFVDVTYPIPQRLVEAAEQGRLTVKFAAREGSTAGGVYGVRLLRAAE